jgi:hypothetical protein
MENFKLASAGFIELSQIEKTDTNGGIAWWIPVAVGVIAYEVATDWDNFKRALAGQPEKPKC